MKSKFRLLLLAVTLVAAGTACGTVGKTPPDQIAIHYEDGEFQAQKFKGCLDPGKRERTGVGDKYFYYPTSQRYVKATGGDGADFDPITVVSKDNVEMRIPITVNFFVKVDCATLRQFHEQVGNRMSMYKQDDGWNDEWRNALRVLIYDPLDTTLDRIAQNYEWRALYNDPDVKFKLENEVNENIAAIVRRQTNDKEFFDRWSALVQKPTPTNEELAKAIAAEQNNVASARAAEAKARADRAAAEAQVAVAKAEAAKEKELIKVLGLEGYLMLKSIEKGMNPYQPSYGQPVTSTP